LSDTAHRYLRGRVVQELLAVNKEELSISEHFEKVLHGV